MTSRLTNPHSLEEPVHRLVSFKDQKGFQEQYEIQLALAECPYLHTFTDVSQYRRSFVFRRPLLDPPTTLAPFMSVNTSGMEVPWEPARQILKDVLHGIARMHSHDIIHTSPSSSDELAAADSDRYTC